MLSRRTPQRNENIQNSDLINSLYRSHDRIYSRDISIKYSFNFCKLSFLAQTFGLLAVVSYEKYQITNEILIRWTPGGFIAFQCHPMCVRREYRHSAHHFKSLGSRKPPTTLCPRQKIDLQKSLGLFWPVEHVKKFKLDVETSPKLYSSPYSLSAMPSKFDHRIHSSSGKYRIYHPSPSPSPSPIIIISIIINEGSRYHCFVWLSSNENKGWKHPGDARISLGKKNVILN